MQQLADARIIIGTPMEGGYFAGYIRVGEDTYGIAVAPKHEGAAVGTRWIDDYQDVPGARSFCDGFANTEAMTAAGSKLAQSIRELRIGDFDDWYLPARDELELLYRAFKPTTETNFTFRAGENVSAVPPTYAYTEESPVQTSVQAFQEGGEQAFEGEWYWSSTQYSRYGAWYQYFGDGGQYDIDKSYEGRARAVRRFKVQ